MQQSKSPIFCCPIDTVFQVITVFPTDLSQTCWDELVFLSLPGAAPPPWSLAFLYFSRQTQVEPWPAYKQVWQLSPTGQGILASWPSTTAHGLLGIEVDTSAHCLECVHRFEETAAQPGVKGALLSYIVQHPCFEGQQRSVHTLVRADFSDWSRILLNVLDRPH